LSLSLSLTHTLAHTNTHTLALTMEMKREGKTVFSLCVGEPDYQPPAEVISATCSAASSGNTKYTSVNGEVALRKAIAADLSARKGTAYTADQIVVSNGAKQAVMQALMTVVSPGDEVLIPGSNHFLTQSTGQFPKLFWPKHSIHPVPPSLTSTLVDILSDHIIVYILSHASIPYHSTLTASHSNTLHHPHASTILDVLP
jgi:hypothetical protein